MTDLLIELKKSHIRLLRHPETRLYAPTVLLGKSEIHDTFPTAYTNGRDKYYGKDFMSKLNLAQICTVVLHENLHVLLKHIMRHMDLMKEDAQLANAAMDYVVNDIIHNLEDKNLCQMTGIDPEPLYDPKFHGWSVREIYNYLKKGQNKDGNSEGKPKRGQLVVVIGNGQFKLEPLDEHDLKEMQEAKIEDIKKLSEEISEAIQQAGILAGLQNVKLPRALEEAAVPDVDWKTEMADFVTSHMKGSDEYTWRKFNTRRL
jgi:predicted metal-dependent peptidase